MCKNKHKTVLPTNGINEPTKSNNLIVEKQINEFNAALMQKMPPMDRWARAYWTGHKKELGERLKDALRVDFAIKVLLDWQEFYWRTFHIKLDFLKEFWPIDTSHGFPVVVLEEMSLDRISLELPKIVRPLALDISFDKAAAKMRNARVAGLSESEGGSPRGYVVYTKFDPEAKGNLNTVSHGPYGGRSMSPDPRGITLIERLLLGLKYRDATGQRLDCKNTTICTGTTWYAPEPFGVTNPVVSHRYNEIHISGWRGEDRDKSTGGHYRCRYTTTGGVNM